SGVGNVFAFGKYFYFRVSVAAFQFRRGFCSGGDAAEDYILHIFSPFVGCDTFSCLGGSQGDTTNCSVPCTFAILQNIRNSWGPCPISSSYFGGFQERPSAFVQAQADVCSFHPGITIIPLDIYKWKL